MKSEIVSQEQTHTQIQYPCIMRYKDNSLHVHFYVEGKGMVVVAGSGRLVGYYSQDWYMPDFTPITQPVTIKFSN